MTNQGKFADNAEYSGLDGFREKKTE